MKSIEFVVDRIVSFININYKSLKPKIKTRIAALLACILTRSEQINDMIFANRCCALYYCSPNAWTLHVK